MILQMVVSAVGGSDKCLEGWGSDESVLRGPELSAGPFQFWGGFPDIPTSAKTCQPLPRLKGKVKKKKKKRESKKEKKNLDRKTIPPTKINQADGFSTTLLTERRGGVYSK